MLCELNAKFCMVVKLSPFRSVSFVLFQLQDTYCLPWPSTLTSILESKISEFLPGRWGLFIDDCVNFFLYSKDVERTTQRRVSISFLGGVTVSVHRALINQNVFRKIVRNLKVVPLSEETIDQFTTYALSVVREVNRYEVCVGCVREEYKCFWKSDGNGRVDLNPFGELRYCETFRPNHCEMLVHPSKQRCMECYKVSELFRKRLKVRCHGVKLNAPNIHLTEEEKISKIKNLKKELESSKRTIFNLQRRINCASDGLPN